MRGKRRDHSGAILITIALVIGLTGPATAGKGAALPYEAFQLGGQLRQSWTDPTTGSLDENRWRDATALRDGMIRMWLLLCGPDLSGPKLVQAVAYTEIYVDQRAKKYNAMLSSPDIGKKETAHKELARSLADHVNEIMVNLIHQHNKCSPPKVYDKHR